MTRDQEMKVWLRAYCASLGGIRAEENPLETDREWPTDGKIASEWAAVDADYALEAFQEQFYGLTQVSEEPSEGGDLSPRGAQDSSPGTLGGAD